MIEVKDLVKRYGNHVAVDHLSFTVNKGQIYGFLGPNGAGKSTTMNIITGCLAATEGTVTIGGKDIYLEAKEAKKLIGYLPEMPPLYQDMTVWEYLCFVAEAKGVGKYEIAPRVRAAMEATSVTNVQDRLIRVLSKGYRQRVGIAQAILGNPEVIILDEPTVGLDPKQIIEIRELIRELGKSHTVILSSHILSEVSELCDTILIINKGKLVACDTPENLEQMLIGEAKTDIVVKGSVEDLQEVLETFGDTVDGTMTDEGNGTVSAEIVTAKDVDIREELFYKLAEKKMPILKLDLNKASLEDIFLELTSEKEELIDEPLEPVSEEEAAEESEEESEEESSEESQAEEPEQKEGED